MSLGYDVEIWRVLTKKSVTFKIDELMYQGDNYLELQYEEYVRKINKAKDGLFVFTESKTKECIAVAKAGRKYIIIGGLGGTYLQENVSTSDKLKRLKRNFFSEGLLSGLKKSLSYIFYRYDYQKRISIYRKALKLNPPAYIFTSTHLVAKRYFINEELSGNVVYIHASDYDRYIETERKAIGEGKKHIVYCDAGLVGKTYDAVCEGVEFETARHKEEYFVQLQDLFEKLEKHYGLPVVIAAHPKTKYEPGDYCGRKVIYNRTCELTRDAAVFIVNSSTAINFAAIYNVPMLQIANRWFKKVYNAFPSLYDYIKEEADVRCGCGFLDLDNKEDMEHPWDFVKKFDAKKRENFLISTIIDSDKMEKTVIEYVEEHIRNIL